jgi:hemerythrin-like domain-containing protein
MTTHDNSSGNGYLPERRNFIKNGLILTMTGTAVVGLLSGCKGEEGEEKEVSPPEDLMQEHGLLNRVLLIYDACRTHLETGTSFPLGALSNAAGVIRSFVEDYHEKQEENYLFPRFKKANQLTDLVAVLLVQHQAGRILTDKIMLLAKTNPLSESEKRTLIQSLTAFNTMYRPHETREDTILFPAFRKIVSKHEYDALGEEFEKNEQKLFGKGGFEAQVDKVAHIEKSLGIYELSQFTPQV